MTDAERIEQRVTGALKRARVRISDPERWTAHHRALTDLGAQVEPVDPAAARWCAVGALEREAGSDRYVYLAGLERLTEVSGSWGPEVINDCQGHAAALAMYDEAIRRK